MCVCVPLPDVEKRTKRLFKWHGRTTVSDHLSVAIVANYCCAAEINRNS